MNYYSVSDNTLTAKLLECIFPTLRTCCTSCPRNCVVVCDVPSLWRKSRNYLGGSLVYRPGAELFSGINILWTVSHSGTLINGD